MADYRSALTGVQMDSALLDMAEHNSEAYAIGERNGVPVVSGDVAYHNNAKYYAQIATSQVEPGNIGDAVRWDTDQSAVLTEAQKATARNNIGVDALATRPNLLDNPWFTVSQRNEGVLDLQESDRGYIADRWYKYDTTSMIIRDSTGNITISGGYGTMELRQNFYAKGLFTNKLNGKPITLSILLDDTVYSGSGMIPLTTPSEATNIIDTTIGNIRLVLVWSPNAASGNIIIVRILVTPPSGGYKLSAAKLEIGETSTLANDAPPNYAEELAKCQRYFLRISNPLAYTYPVGIGIVRGVNSVDFVIQQSMNITNTAPTVTYSGSFSAAGKSVTSFSVFGLYNQVVLRAWVPLGSALTEDAGARLTAEPDSYIDISFDL